MSFYPVGGRCCIVNNKGDFKGKKAQTNLKDI